MDWKRFFPQMPNADESFGYRVYDRRYDRIVHASELRQKLTNSQRSQLEELTEQYTTQVDRWAFDQRFKELVANDGAAEHSGGGICATILIDQSGSLKGDLAILVCMAAEIIAEAWERRGARTEILGFTTATWRGGNARTRWLEEGRPPNPGRLCDLLHIIYKDADAKLSSVRWTLPLLLLSQFRKENVDGEALLWAADRLEAQVARRRILLVLSDGVPADDSTLSVNHASILLDHLKLVVQHLSAQPDFSVAALGIMHETGDIYPQSLTLESPDDIGAKALPFALSLVE